MASAVATPLERQFGQIASVTQMTSTSTLGATTIVIQFDLNRNIDAAAQDVQAAITAASRTLPLNLTTPPVYRKTNPADVPIMIFGMRSDTLPLTTIDEFADNYLVQQLSQVPGVAQVFIGGESKPAIHVQLDPAKLAAGERLYPGILATSDFRHLLKDSRIDAVAIATPVHTHYELALAALKAGKHVFVEKPLAPTADQVRRLIDEADKRNLILMVDHTFLYTPAVQKIRELVQEGALGDLYYYDSIRSSLGLFQSDVNVIWDLAVHDISIIQHILDEEPTSVSATGSSHVTGAPENMAHITLFFEGSCVAHINVNWLSPIKVRQTFIGGSRKMIVYDDVEPTEKIKVYDKGITVNGSTEKRYQALVGYRSGDVLIPKIDTTEALQRVAQEFVSSITENRAPLTDGMAGYRVVRILEAAQQSLEANGREVLLQEAVLESLARS